MNKFQIPILYRGDCCENKIIKGNNRNSIFSKLINNGNPAEIKKLLKDLIDKHVGSTWCNTHLISFTSDRTTAKKYALGRNSTDGINAIPEYPIRRMDLWKWAIIELIITDDNCKCKEIIPGVYKITYEAYSDTHYAMLMDLEELCATIKDFSEETMQKSKTDKEWLILPCDPFPSYPKELSAEFFLTKGSSINYYTDTAVHT